MQIDKVLDKVVDRAFKSLSSLSKKATVETPKSATFDFNQSETISTPDSDTVDIIIVQSKPSSSTNRREFTAIIRTKLEIGIRNKIVVGTQKFEIIGDPQKTRNAVLCTLVEVK